MDEKQGETSSDSEFGDSWTIVDKTSFCNRVMDVISAFECDKVFEEYSDLPNVRDCTLNFQDDSNNDADADSDGISVISENEEHLISNSASSYSRPHTPPSSPEPNHCCLETQHENSKSIQPGTRTPKKNKSKYNKPITPPNTPVDCEPPLLQEKSEKKHKKRSYIHNRNDKVSNILNILVAGTIATAAGLAFGHLMGSKSECSNLGAGVKNDLTFKQLQYENLKLRHELQDLKRESIHFNSRLNKHAKARKNVSESASTNISSNSSKYNDHSRVQHITHKNNLLVAGTNANDSVFFGPKTYADTINSNMQKFDVSEVRENVNTHSVHFDVEDSENSKKGNSVSNVDVHKSKPTGLPEVSPLNISKPSRNHSYPSIHEPDVKAEAKEIKKIPRADDICLESENCKTSKQKNRKIKPNSTVKDPKSVTNTEELEGNVNKPNLQKSNNGSSKLRKKTVHKDRIASKKGRSVSSGKESGDFGNSAISLEDKLGEKLSTQKIAQSQIKKPKAESNNSQKNSKLDNKYKEKNNDMQNTSEINNNNKVNRKQKTNKTNNKYSEEDLSQKLRNEVKRNNKKEKILSKTDIPKSDQSSNQEVKLNKDKRNNDKLLKTKQKNDRRKSDFRQEKKDKYEDWEMNRGYEYYLSHMDGLTDDFSDDEMDHHSNEKVMYTTDDTVYSKAKPKSKKAHEKKANYKMNDFDSQSEHWATISEAKTSGTDIHEIDGSWVDGIAKYREEQRNKQKESDWLFERAKERDLKRDKAAWYFKRMNEREQCRVQDRNKRNNSKRSSKKSPNYRSKL